MTTGPGREIRRLLAEAHAHIEIGNSQAAFELIHRAEGFAPPPPAWRAIGDAWHAAGNASAGGAAHLRAVRASVRDPELAAAAEALAKGLPDAEALLQARLAAHPTDAAAMRMLAELAARLDRSQEAEALLRRALALAPGFAVARHSLAALLHRQARNAEARVEIARLLADDPANQAYRELEAAMSATGGPRP